jgi:hypothetical protein
MYDYPYIVHGDKAYEQHVNIMSAYQRLQTMQRFIDDLRPKAPGEMGRLECPYLDELAEIRRKIRKQAVDEFIDQVIKISLDQIKPRII